MKRLRLLRLIAFWNRHENGDKLLAFSDYLDEA